MYGTGGYIEKTTKTESGIRSIPVSWSLVQSIIEVKKRGRDSERVLDLKPALVDRRWNRLRTALNLPENMRFYDLRHFYATLVAYSGASEEELASMMGHSTSSFSHAVYVELFS